MGALGVGLMAYGASLVWRTGSAAEVAVWLVGAVLLHDAVVAPLVLGVGLLLGAVPARGLVRGALVVAGGLTLIALPVLLAPYRPRANRSVLPLPYERNWLLLMALVALLATALAAARHAHRLWQNRHR